MKKDQKRFSKQKTRRTTMSTKSNLIIGLAAVVVSGGLVFNGVSRLRSNNSTALALQNMPAQPAVVTPADPANPAVDPATDSAATTTDADQTADTADAANTQDTDSTNTDTKATENDPQPAQPVQTAVVRTVRSTTRRVKQVVTATPVADASSTSDADATAAPDPVKPIVVPVGTAVTIRLGEELGSKISEEGQNFSATVDQDVIVGGKTAIPAGSTVSGKVVAAKPVGALHGEAELQLKLTSVKVNNANVHVATATRSFGPQIKGKNKVGKFFKGLAKRAEGDEREVVLAENSAYSFTLQKSLQIQ
jgi:cytoskeletal protein RodZ